MSDRRLVCPLLEADPLPPDDRRTAFDGTAVDVLYRSQAPRLLRFFSRKAGRQEASDLVQETFARFSTTLERRVAPLRSPEAYLSQVAVNLLRNRARAAFVRTVTAQPMPEDVADLHDMTAALEARDLLDRIERAMTQLAPKTRDIFLAHRIDGASYAQIAERMALSVKTIELHMTKALRHLHRSLGKQRLR